MNTFRYLGRLLKPEFTHTHIHSKQLHVVYSAPNTVWVSGFQHSAVKWCGCISASQLGPTETPQRLLDERWNFSHDTLRFMFHTLVHANLLFFFYFFHFSTSSTTRLYLLSQSWVLKFSTRTKLAQNHQASKDVTEGTKGEVNLDILQTQKWKILSVRSCSTHAIVFWRTAEWRKGLKYAAVNCSFCTEFSAHCAESLYCTFCSWELWYSVGATVAQEGGQLQ